MTEQQMPKLISALIEHQDGLKRLSTDNAQWMIQNTKEAINLFIEAVNSRSHEAVAKSNLLEFLDITLIPATAEKFVVADNFKKDNADGVAISIIWESFQTLCGDIVEEPIKEAIELRRHKLLRSEVDKPIIVELGNEAVAKTFFAAIWELMKLQKNGEKGKLLTSGNANIFYVRVKNVLLAIHVYWHAGGWRVYASSVGGPDGWCAGYRVFSSNSVSLAV